MQTAADLKINILIHKLAEIQRRRSQTTISNLQSQ